MVLVDHAPLNQHDLIAGVVAEQGVALQVALLEADPRLKLHGPAEAQLEPFAS